MRRCGDNTANIFTTLECNGEVWRQYSKYIYNLRLQVRSGVNIANIFTALEYNSEVWSQYSKYLYNFRMQWGGVEAIQQIYLQL